MLTAGDWRRNADRKRTDAGVRLRPGGSETVSYPCLTVDIAQRDDEEHALELRRAILAAPDVADPLLGDPAGGLPYLVITILGSTLGKIFLGCVVFAITVCCLAVHTAAVRLAFARQVRRGGLAEGAQPELAVEA